MKRRAIKGFWRRAMLALNWTAQMPCQLGSCRLCFMESLGVNAITHAAQQQKRAAGIQDDEAVHRLKTSTRGKNMDHGGEVNCINLLLMWRLCVAARENFPVRHMMVWLRQYINQLNNRLVVDRSSLCVNKMPRRR